MLLNLIIYKDVFLYLVNYEFHETVNTILKLKLCQNSTTPVRIVRSANLARAEFFIKIEHSVVSHYVKFLFQNKKNPNQKNCDKCLYIGFTSDFSQLFLDHWNRIADVVILHKNTSV